MKLWPFRAKSALTPYSSGTLAQLLAAVFGGGATKSGATVTWETALQVSTVLACLRAIAEGVAQVPFQVMQETAGDKLVPAKEHPLYRIVHRQPNRWQTSFGLRESMVFHAALNGNAYAYKNRVGSDQLIVELILIPSNRMRVDVQDNGDLVYIASGRNGAERVLKADDVWHLRGPSWDGQIGMQVLQLARESIGLAMAAEETQGQLHAKGVRTSGVYSIDGTLTGKQYEELAAWLTKEFAGNAAAGKPMILDRNAKWVPNSMTAVDAQHLETRKHQVEEVCRALRVMPIMVGQSDKAATYASAEQMFIAHLVHTLLPWYERIEQSADIFLLTERDRDQGYYTFLDPVGMLRGALRDTAEYLYRLVSLGVMTRNEARRKLDLNPINGLDEPLTPANLITDAINNPAAAGA